MYQSITKQEVPMNQQLKLLSFILSSFFLFSCVHTHNGKIFFKTSSHKGKSAQCCKSKEKCADSYKGKKDCKSKGKKCSDSCKKDCKSKGKKCADSYKKDCKSKGKKCADSCKKDCKSKGKKCADSCKKGKCKSHKNSCGKRDSLVGVALVTGFGNKIKGNVSFEKAGYKQVELNAQIKGLKPNQKFGFHVHEFGNCEDKAILAGAHLNPNDGKHGSPNNAHAHLGDLGNLTSNAQGKAELTLVLKGKLRMFMGRSVIIHEAMDDLKSQPTGNAGKRIACGIIGVGSSPVEVTEKKELKQNLKATPVKASTQNLKATPVKASTQKLKATPVKASTQNLKTTPVKASTQNLKATPVKASTQNLKATPVKASTQNLKATPVKASTQNLKATPVKASTQNLNATPVEASTQEVNATPVEASTQEVNATPVEASTQEVNATPVEASTQKVNATPVKASDQKVNATPVKASDQKVNATPVKASTQKVNATPVKASDQKVNTQLL